MHVYALPPGAVSTKAGYAAASWTTDPRNHIFTARLRVLETSYTTTTTSSSSPSPSLPQSESSQPSQSQQPPTTTPTPTTVLKVDILLEDPASGALFAAAPYATPAAVEPASDSSRFFAVRVVDPAGAKKATLGIGFEERGDAFDFGVALQEARRALGWRSSSTTAAAAAASSGPLRSGVGSSGGSAAGSSGNLDPKSAGRIQGHGWEEEEKRDLSLKEGETITVNLKGTRFGRRAAAGSEKGEAKGEEEGKSLASFALPPPPGSSGGGAPFLPPPPSAREARAQKRLSAQQLGFDDGQFGEFA